MSSREEGKKKKRMGGGKGQEKNKGGGRMRRKRLPSAKEMERRLVRDRKARYQQWVIFDEVNERLQDASSYLDPHTHDVRRNLFRKRYSLAPQRHGLNEEHDDNKVNNDDVEMMVEGKLKTKKQKKPQPVLMMDLIGEEEEEEGEEEKEEGSDKEMEKRPSSVTVRRKLKKVKEVEETKEDSHVRRMREQLKDLEDYELHVSAGVPTRQWIHMDRDQTDPSKSRLVVDKTHGVSGCDKTEEDQKRLSDEDSRPLLLPPALAQAVTSTPVVLDRRKTYRLDKTCVFPVLASPPRENLNVSAIDYSDSTDDSAVIVRLPESPSFNNNSTIAHKFQDSKTSEVVPLKTLEAVRRLSVLWGQRRNVSMTSSPPSVIHEVDSPLSSVKTASLPAVPTPVCERVEEGSVNGYLSSQEDMFSPSRPEDTSQTSQLDFASTTAVSTKKPSLEKCDAMADTVDSLRSLSLRDSVDSVDIFSPIDKENKSQPTVMECNEILSSLSDSSVADSLDLNAQRESRNLHRNSDRTPLSAVNAKKNKEKSFQVMEVDGESEKCMWIGHGIRSDGKKVEEMNEGENGISWNEEVDEEASEDDDDVFEDHGAQVVEYDGDVVEGQGGQLAEDDGDVVEVTKDEGGGDVAEVTKGDGDVAEVTKDEGDGEVAEVTKDEGDGEVAEVTKDEGGGDVAEVTKGDGDVVEVTKDEGDGEVAEVTKDEASKIEVEEESDGAEIEVNEVEDEGSDADEAESEASEIDGEVEEVMEAYREIEQKTREENGRHDMTTGLSMSKCSDMSVNATKCVFSRMSMAKGEVPFYMAGEDADTSPMGSLLHVCNQRLLYRWDQVLDSQMLESCVKIGEGVYGEVFRARRPNGTSVAIKVIPIEGKELVNDEPQKSFEEILPEILIAKELSTLREPGRYSTPNFAELLSASVVTGCYPNRLLDTWNEFAQTRQSENDCPDMFGRDQLFVLLEFGDGGQDLESFDFVDVREGKSVFAQVTMTLAVAEQAIEFEHRDLHIGNVLVARTQSRFLNYTLAGDAAELPSCGVHVYIIDFTNSRLRKEGVTIFTDLSTDGGLFEGPSTDYQFEIYRMMRDFNGNSWREFCPKTNLYWLHYLLDKLISFKKYNRRKMHVAVQRQLRPVFHSILDSDDCMDFLVSNGIGNLVEELRKMSA